MLGMLKRTFSSRDTNLWAKLYRSLVRPYLDYASQVWNPSLEKESEIIEKVQRRATKIPKDCKYLNYDQRLQKFGLTRLKQRRTRGDLILMYKILRLNVPIVWTRKPTTRADSHGNRPASSLRGAGWHITRQSFSSKQLNSFREAVNRRYNFFVNRVVPSWNNLPENIVNSKTLEQFKIELDKIRY